MKVTTLLDAAGSLLDEPALDTQTVWPLGAAVLVRQSIEKTLDVFWTVTVKAMVGATMADKWAALPFYLGRRDEADAAHYSWRVLSAACHQRDYDVGLTSAELRGHHDAALAFARVVAVAIRAGRPSTAEPPA